MRSRAITGFIAAALLLASAVAHGVMGWPELRASLAQVGAGTDLIGGVGAGWLFGSVAMAVFAAQVFMTARGLWRGKPVNAGSVVAIGLRYLLFGLSALALLHVSPPLVSFVVVGALLLVFAAWPRRRSGETSVDT